MEDITSKKCIRCEEIKTLDDFYRDKSIKDGHEIYCKSCRKEKYIERREHIAEYGVRRYAEKREELLEISRKYHLEHPEIQRKSRLKCKYGITIEEYDEMLEAQDGVCAICGITPEENGRRLSVDHDHETGEIRGLLCLSCNAALGHLKDSSEMCELAKMYLQIYGR